MKYPIVCKLSFLFRSTYAILRFQHCTRLECVSVLNIIWSALMERISCDPRCNSVANKISIFKLQTHSLILDFPGEKCRKSEQNGIVALEKIVATKMKHGKKSLYE